MLASGSYDGTIKLWNFKIGTLIKTIEIKPHIDSVAFSPDGTMLASGSNDNTIKLWKLYSKKEIKELKDKISPVCLLLLQSIQYTYKQGHPINLPCFPELHKVFKSLKPNEKELVECLLSDIAMEKKRKRRKIEQNK